MKNRPSKQEVDNALRAQSLSTQETDDGFISWDSAEIMAVEIRALREDLAKRGASYDAALIEIMRSSNRIIELYDNLEAIQSDYNAYAVLAKSVRDEFEKDSAWLKNELEKEKSDHAQFYDEKQKLVGRLLSEAQARDRAIAEKDFVLRWIGNILHKDCSVSWRDDEGRDHVPFCEKIITTFNAKWQDFLDKEKA